MLFSRDRHSILNSSGRFSECVFRYTQLLYEAKLDETELVAFPMLQLFRRGKFAGQYLSDEVEAAGITPPWSTPK